MNSMKLEYYTTYKIITNLHLRTCDQVTSRYNKMNTAPFIVECKFCFHILYVLYHKLSNIYAKKVCLRQTEGPFEGRFIAKTRRDVNYLYGFTCVC